MPSTWGWSRWRPSTPDLVVLSYDPGDLRDGLAALGIPTLLFDPPLTLEDAYGQMRALGSGDGPGARGGRPGGRDRGRSRPPDSGRPGSRDPFTYYYELDPTLYSLTSSTFVGGLFGLLGMENIADAADAAGTGYPQLSAEFVLAADPDFVFLADTQLLRPVGGRPWRSGPAGPLWRRWRRGGSCRWTTTLASRWGPRLVDLLAAVAGAITAPGGG